MVRNLTLSLVLLALANNPTYAQDAAKAAPPKAGAKPPAAEEPAAVSDKITLNVRDTSLGQIIELLSVQQQVNIVAGVDTNRPVTVNFFEADLEDALDWILGPLNLGWYFDGKTYTILERDQIELIQKPLVEKVFRPNYRSAAEMQSYLTGFLSSHGQIIISEEPEIGIPSGEKDTGGMASTGQEMVVVIDNEASLERISRLVKDFDERPRQVLVEATIVQIVLDETNRFGVDFQFLGEHDYTDFESSTAPQSVYSGPTTVVPGEIGDITAPFLTHAGTKSVSQQGFTEGPGSTGMRLGYVGKGVSFFLDALQTVADTNVLANTKVMALNKMRAEIIIGGRLGYFGGSTVSDGISQQTIEFLEVGTQLRFRPFIGDDGFIRLEIHPERSSGIVDPVTGLPTETTTEVTTNVMVRDGETVVIGGLIETRESQTTSRVPLLGYLPLIGWLFSTETTEVERTEIVVMLTPHILEDGEVLDDGQLLMAEAADRSRIFVDGFGAVSRRTHAQRTFIEAQEALDKGNLAEARFLCDRVIALDPLADGVVEMSLEIDERLANVRRTSVAGDE